MAKANANTETNVKPAGDARDTSNDITVDEYCQRKSRTDKRVELIGAFHFDQKRSGRVKDSEAAFESRFEAFVNKPA